jgi:serine/threonine-protein kinase
VTATLTHPNTVQIFDYGHAEDGTFPTWEYLPGGLEVVDAMGLAPSRVITLQQPGSSKAHGGA